jgi:hypothetical protein
MSEATSKFRAVQGNHIQSRFLAPKEGAVDVLVIVCIFKIS